MKKITLVIGLVLTATSLFACNKEPEQSCQGKQDHPSIEEIMTKLDSNKDGKISKKEAEGPLERDFAKIDLDKDGFITKAELEKAPKPKGGPKGERPAKR